MLHLPTVINSQGRGSSANSSPGLVNVLGERLVRLAFRDIRIELEATRRENEPSWGKSQVRIQLKRRLQHGTHAVTYLVVLEHDDLAARSSNGNDLSRSQSSDEPFVHHDGFSQSSWHELHRDLLYDEASSRGQVFGGN